MLSSGYDRMVDEERLKSSGSNKRYGTRPERVSFHLKNTRFSQTSCLWDSRGLS